MTDVHASTATPTEGSSSDGARPAAGTDTSLLVGLAAVVVFGGGLTACARYSALALLIGVAVVQAAFASAWVFGTGMPGRKGALVIAAMAAAAADVTVSVWPHGRLGAVLAVLGLSVPVMFVHQLGRGAARTRLVSSMSSIGLLVVSVVALPSVIQLRHEFVDHSFRGLVAQAVLAALAGSLLVAYLVDLVLPVPRFDPEVPRGMLALLAAAVVGGALAYLILKGHAEYAGGRSVFVGAALGALAALLAVATAFVQHSAGEPIVRIGGALRPVYAAILPLCLLAPAALLLCLAIRA